MRVVVVGGGFGGLACARALEGAPVDVLLLDQHNYHLFTPLLYQVATSLLNPSDIAYPFRTVFRRSRNVRFRQARVTHVDMDGQRVRLNSGDELAYDVLVLATGSQNDYFSNEALARHTVGMRVVPEALRLRNHVLSSLELATRAASDDARRALLTFVIVGGGPTGVEYAGALAELLDMVLGRDYPELDRRDARVVVVEGVDRLLSAFHHKLGEYARRTLRSRGVEVRTSTLVRTADEGGVDLSTGERIASGTVVWSAGVRPVDPLAEAVRSRSRRVEVDERLRLAGRDDVFVIGDAASLPAGEGGAELPMLSPPAMQEGRYVARSIRDRAAGRMDTNRPPFRYVDKGTMATIGRRAAVADLHGLKLRGTLGWLAWLLVHIYYLIGFRNRAAVLASWGWNYLRKDRPIRVILRSDEDALASELETG
jgi:NADH:ubiquinone reductase (H+-translocating)